MYARLTGLGMVADGIEIWIQDTLSVLADLPVPDTY